MRVNFKWCLLIGLLISSLFFGTSLVLASHDSSYGILWSGSDEIFQDMDLGDVTSYASAFSYEYPVAIANANSHSYGIKLESGSEGNTFQRIDMGNISSTADADAVAKFCFWWWCWFGHAKANASAYSSGSQSLGSTHKNGSPRCWDEIRRRYTSSRF